MRTVGKTIVKVGDTGLQGGGRPDSSSPQPLVVRERFFPADPARDIVPSIVQVVPVSDWAFASFTADGDPELFFASTPALDRRWWAQQVPHHTRGQAGYRIGPVLHGLGNYASGVALTFADRRTEFGTLTLLRTRELGPFSSAEIRLLVFALDWASERLSSERLMEAQEEPDRRRAGEHLEVLKEARDDTSALYVLDGDFSIVLGWSELPEEIAAMAVSATRLPSRIEQAVRELTCDWTAEPATRKTGVARPSPFLMVLTQPLVGPSGYFIGVVVQLYREPHSLIAAAARFAMSPREAQVLVHLLEGSQIPEIGERLFITSSTVQDHIKSLLHKTGSKNRSHMIAQVLGWGRE
jgi:DNA-binding CsgD family transcriptional regulator